LFSPNALIPCSDTENQLAFMIGIQDNYKFHIWNFIDWMRKNDLVLNYSTIQDYFVYLNTSGYAASSVNVKRAAVKKRIRQLADAGQFDVDMALRLDRALSQLDREPGTKARKINTPEIGQEKLISTEEFSLLLGSARSDRQRLFMRFLWVSGCRVSEMLSIKRQNVRIEGSTAFIRITGKGAKERVLRIPSTLHNSIVSTFKGSIYLFETSSGKPYTRSYVSAQIKKLGKKFLRRSISAHSFRHSFATRKIAETGKIKAVSRYLGHSSTSITLNMYVHESLTEEELFS